jgi:hypothetical protein
MACPPTVTVPFGDGVGLSGGARDGFRAFSQVFFFHAKARSCSVLPNVATPKQDQGENPGREGFRTILNAPVLR